MISSLLFEIKLMLHVNLNYFIHIGLWSIETAPYIV